MTGKHISDLHNTEESWRIKVVQKHLEEADAMSFPQVPIISITQLKITVIHCVFHDRWTDKWEWIGHGLCCKDFVSL